MTALIALSVGVCGSDATTDSDSSSPPQAPAETAAPAEITAPAETAAPATEPIDTDGSESAPGEAEIA